MTNGIGHQFMRNTQYKHMEQPDQQKGLPQPPLELPYDVTQRLIDLPAPDELDLEPVNLRKLIEDRTTTRNYVETPITLAELSYLLWCTQGVKGVRESYATLRTVPSAGARHAFETLLLVNRVEGLEPGGYRFVASLHKLVRLDLGDNLTRRLAHACRNQEQVARSAATLFWVAVPYRMTFRYGERGFRYLHLDAGHVCQNLYLAAEAIGCGVCAIAAFDDEQLNTTLGLDGETQFVIYLASLGRRI
jgi:SagB-type dehydrogenase family enzyme